jgi:glutaminyl-tRNA synthetase
MPATVLKDTKSGTLGSNAVTVEIRLYDRLFNTEHPDTGGSAGGKDFLEALNPNSLQTITAYAEPALAKPDDEFQFERHGYFVADRKDHIVGKSIFNLATSLKDSWGK